MTIPEAPRRGLFALTAVVLFAATPTTAVRAQATPTVAAPAPPTTAAVAAPTWETLRAAYAVDTPPAKVEEESVSDDASARTHLAFTNAGGAKVTGLLLRPKDAAGKALPVALLLHGLGSSKEQMITRFAPALLRRGFAVFALDAQGHGERKGPEGIPTAPLAFAQSVRTTVTDYRQALGYLAARRDVDPKRIALMGYSMGAMTGAILAGVDERVGAAALIVGGDPVGAMLPSIPEPLRPLAHTVSTANYVGRISPRPVYFLNGRKDTTIPEAVVTSYHAAAREPKTVVWAEDGGHLLPAPVLAPALDWLSDRLNGRPLAPPAAVSIKTP